MMIPLYERFMYIHLCTTLEPFTIPQMAAVLSREAGENGVRLQTTSGGRKMEEMKMEGEGDERDGCQAIHTDVILGESGGSTMT